MKNDGKGMDFEDGFASNQDDQDNFAQFVPTSRMTRSEHEPEKELAVKMIEPAQEIKKKNYSLHPDIVTGWKPKISLPKPIPLTFPWTPVDLIIKQLSKTVNQEVKLIYLGPRFNNTYSAWKLFGLHFPYGHMGEMRPILTDRKFVGIKPHLPPSEVHFDSLFESGNLDCALRVGECEYDCLMRVDSNTAGHFQWFYFRMCNLKPHSTYRINLCNFQKIKSLYSRGMKPYMRHRLKNSWSQWKQEGSQIIYSKKKAKVFNKLSIEVQEKYYRLSFTIKTEQNHQPIEIAYCPPYTYTFLLEYLKSLHEKNHDRGILREETLCFSLGSLRLPLLTITSNVSEEEEGFKDQKAAKGKLLIFVMGRIHPGESNGSYTMEGFIEWICGYSQQAEQLRNMCVFKVLPMTNPDGVVLGNYRTGLSGRDFNREFINPESDLFVEVDHLKRYLQKCRWIYQKQFLFFFDFHGHSVKKNVFAYGPQYPITNHRYYECRIFPKLISRKTSLFRFYSCVFRVHPSKGATARAVLLRQLGIPFPFTIEASNGYYYNYRILEDIPFSCELWLEMGQKVVQTLHEYLTFLKKIEEQKIKKAKEKNIIMKPQRKARIQSSYMKGYPSNKVKNIHYMRNEVKEPTIEDFAFKELLNELNFEQDERQVKCSDDEMSEGKSDSQNSEDDLDRHTIQQLFHPQTKSHDISHKKSKQTPSHSQKKQTYVRVLKSQKHSSFLTECDQPFEDSTLILGPKEYEKRKKLTLVRRRFPTAGGTPSPVREPIEMTSAKVVNLSFCLNPIPVAFSSVCNIPDSRSRKLKTQGESYIQPRTSKPEIGQSYRRTYLSLQRELMRKQSKKTTSSTTQNFRPSLRFQQIVGKRIFE